MSDEGMQDDSKVYTLAFMFSPISSLAVDGFCRPLHAPD